jgi:hypothetical protein
MFAKGVELLPIDRGSRLDGSGKAARHIALTGAEQAARPEGRELLVAAAARTAKS